MVGSGSGGWDVPWSSFEWQLKQMQLGRGIMVFDDGWHKLSTALWLFGPVREVRAWIGTTSFGSGIDIDAPAMISWEHENGIRGVWDITLAPDLYSALGLLHQRRALGDHRHQGLRAGQPHHGAAASSSPAWRCTATARCGATTRSMMTGRVASATPAGTGCAGCGPVTGPLLWSGQEAVDVLRFALAAYESSARGGVGSTRWMSPRAAGLAV